MRWSEIDGTPRLASQIKAPVALTRSRRRWRNANRPTSIDGLRACRSRRGIHPRTPRAPRLRGHPDTRTPGTDVDLNSAILTSW